MPWYNCVQKKSFGFYTLQARERLSKTTKKGHREKKGNYYGNTEVEDNKELVLK